MSFGNCIQLCNLYIVNTEQLWNFYHSQHIEQSSLSSIPYLSSIALAVCPQSLALDTPYVFYHFGFVFSSISYKWNKIAYILLYLTYLWQCFGDLCTMLNVLIFFSLSVLLHYWANDKPCIGALESFFLCNTLKSIGSKAGWHQTQIFTYLIVLKIIK